MAGTSLKNNSLEEGCVHDILPHLPCCRATGCLASGVVPRQKQVLAHNVLLLNLDISTRYLNLYTTRLPQRHLSAF